eukprot:TRINITY_DN1658_c0_g1_i2.p1 TRINITY_DN1658_c0_g1~~TRINITY_DN1658_c0_g1_i2.p1  ORF type:complete len:877 (+),score=167.36 TRINITY_DN1658_c0_g1_i2:69-2699(+)
METQFSLPRIQNGASNDAHETAIRLQKASPRLSWGLPPRRTIEDLYDGGVMSDVQTNDHSKHTSSLTPRVHQQLVMKQHNHKDMPSPRGPILSARQMSVDAHTHATSAPQQLSTLQMQVKFTEATHSLGGEVRPSHLRLIACCDLMDQLCQSLGPQKEMANMLREELYYCIFRGYDSGMSLRQYSNLTPWFELGNKHIMESKVLSEERQLMQELRRQLAVAEQKRLYSLKSIIKRWQNRSLASAFYQWKQLITIKQFRDSIAEKTRMYRNINLLRSSLRLWRTEARNQVASRNIYNMKDQIKMLHSENENLRDTMQVLEASCERFYSQMSFFKDQTRYFREQLVEEVNNTKQQEITLSLGRLCASVGNELISFFREQMKEMLTKRFQHPRLIFPTLSNETITNKAERESREELILAWANYQLKQAGSAHEITNFHSDVRSCIPYAQILDHLGRNFFTSSVLSDVSKHENRCVRATIVLQRAKMLGVYVSIVPEDLGAGEVENSDQHAGFLGALLLHQPGLEYQLDDLRDLYYIFDKMIEAWDDINCWDVKRDLPVDLIDEFLKKMSMLQKTIARLHDDSVTQTGIWEKICESVRDRTQAYILRRIAGDRVVIDEEELRMLEERGQEVITKTKDLLEMDSPAGEDNLTITRILGAYLGDLKRIYLYYGRGTNMTVQNYREFVVACRLVPKEGSYVSLESIFLHPESLKLNQIGADNIKAEVTLNEFIEALIRFADQKYKMTRSNLVDRFRAFIENDILPYASQSDPSRFRKDFKKPLIQALFDTHSAKLKKVFRYYSALDLKTELSRQHQDSINITEFTLLCRDIQLGEIMTSMHMKKLFSNILRTTQSQETDLSLEVSDTNLCAIQWLFFYCFHEQ